MPGAGTPGSSVAVGAALPLEAAAALAAGLVSAAAPAWFAVLRAGPRPGS